MDLLDTAKTPAPLEICIFQGLFPSGQTEIVDIALCNADMQPDTRHPCKPGMCLYTWEASDWGMCDSACAW